MLAVDPDQTARRTEETACVVGQHELYSLLQSVQQNHRLTRQWLSQKQTGGSETHPHTAAGGPSPRGRLLCFSGLGDTSRELGPLQPPYSVLHEGHLSRPYPWTGCPPQHVRGPGTNTRRASAPSGPAPSTASSPASFCPFLLLTKHRCPDVPGTWHSAVLGAGKTPAVCARGAADVGSHLPERNATSEVGEPAGPDAFPLHGGLI